MIHNGALYKSVRFDNPKYVGDPLNAVRIFNEKLVDELIVVDIDATVNRREPNYSLIHDLAAECTMPICYCGGVKTIDQIESIISMGVEKVGLGSACIHSPKLLIEASRRVGSQSIVAVLDVKKTGFLRSYDVFTHNGRRRVGRNPVDVALELQDLGVGEILLNSIDRDGTLNGYDFDLIDSVKSVLDVPLTVVGGAGSLSDLGLLFARYGVIGAAAGSIFVFKGKYRAVLIQCPNASEKIPLFSSTF